MATVGVRPAIAVVGSFRSLGLGEAVDALVRELADRAMRAVVEAGGDPTLIDLGVDDPPPPEEIRRQFAGILILGGADVDPACYGEQAHPETSGIDPAVDHHEIALVREALAADVPLVGICRGMQVMNVACGGTLVQDLGSQTPHHGTTDAVMLSEQVHVIPQSQLGQMLGRAEVEVRTGHHQAVARVAPGYRVVATAADGVIEAIEYETGWAIGVQWHPEDPQANARDLAALAAALIAHARETSRMSPALHAEVVSQFAPGGRRYGSA